MKKGLWARITGKDKRKQIPEQQGVALGRVGDLTIVFPYGHYADLPDDAFLRVIDKGVAISMAEKRPSDSAQGEPVFFHPATNTRVICRNDGSLDIETGNGGTAPVNINCTSANITASSSVTVDTPASTFTGNVQIDGNLNVGGNTTTVGTTTSATVAATSSLTVGGLEMKTHYHSQGNDSDGSVEQDTSGPKAP